MNNPSMALPPLSQVAAALRLTTEILAQELSVPGSHPPAWTDFEWHIARAVAAMHGVSSLFYDRLRWEGPEGWRRFLREQRDQSVARHRKITGLLQAIDSQACSAGVALVALKGAALYASEVYAAGERPMGDIDLLVRVSDRQAISRVLETCGYAAASSTLRHDIFQPRAKKIVTAGRLGEHIDNPIKIEVHTRIAELLPINPIDITEFLFPSSVRAGLNQYPCAASLMLHLLLHAAGNMRARALRLIQLHDIALLAARFTADDWAEMLALCPVGRTLWWALAPLMLTENYYPARIPSDLFSRLRLECPPLLLRRVRQQRLADVSWSNIRIAAFPGVEWSRSGREAFAFIKSRIWPSRDALAELKEGAAQIPGSSTVSWYGLPHAIRILRWVYSRPPRVQTLLSVRAALAPEDSVLAD